MLQLIMTAGLASMLAACGSVADSAASTSANTDWPEAITLVQMPNENNPQVASLHTALREHLEDKLDIKVNEHDGASYAIGIEALASGNLDIMLGSPMSYYQAKRMAGAELLVTPKSELTEYYTVFITQGDNDKVNDMEDLRGTNFAFVNAASSSGYLYPKGTLVQEFALDPDRVEQSGYFFENVTFSESHQNSVIGVAMGDFETAAAAGSIIDRLIEAGTIKEGDVKVIGRTQDIPDASYFIRGDLPDGFKDAVREAFVSFEDEAYFEALHGDPQARFIATEQDYYDSSFELLAAINALEEEQ